MENIYNKLKTSSFYKDENTGLFFVRMDFILNNISLNEITDTIQSKIGNDFVELMIHEQYFYKDYKAYQPDFKDKIIKAIDFLVKNDYHSVFLDSVL